MAIGGVVQPNSDISVLEAAVDACFNTPMSCLNVADVSDRLVALVALTSKLDALRIDTVRAGDAVDVGQLSDQRNTPNHVAFRTNTDPAFVRADQRLSMWLADFPVLAKAHRAAAIHTAHVEKLRLADNPRVHQQLITDQHRFVTWFTSCHFRDLDDLITQWLLGADPDGAEPKNSQPYVGLTIKPLPGGLAKISGICDPLQAAALKDAIATEANKLRAKEQQTGSGSTVRSRTLDALLNLVGRGDARPNGTFARPRVNIVMSQNVYEQTLNWLADPTNNRFPHIDNTDIDKKCQLIDGTPIHPLYALAATVTATFRRIIYNARGRPINASFDSRQIPGWIKDITLITTNGKCANPVCDAPFSWLHADHITPYSHTQNTSVTNTRPLCEPDNLWRSNNTTRGKWTTSDDQNGEAA